MKLGIMILLILVGLYYYNFRWVEFVPQQMNERGWNKWKSREDWWDNAPIELKECLKKSLTYYNQDYKMDNNTLYIRAYLQRDREEISYYSDGWGVPNKIKNRSCFNPDGRPRGNDKREGFFGDFIGFNQLSRFLDKLFLNIKE